MSITNIVILGLLIERDMSAYDMVKAVQFRRLEDWIAISEPGIYKTAKKLEEKMYLKSYDERKKIYQITETGREYFLELMEEQVTSLKQIHLNFTPILMNIHKVPQNEAKEILENLKNEFDRHQALITQQLTIKQHLPPHAIALMELYKGIYDFLSEWIRHFIQIYQDMQDKLLHN